MRFGTNVWNVEAGAEIAVWIEDGPPNGIAKVELDDPASPQHRPARLQIPLDANGAGWVPWIVPAWVWVRFTCEGCQQMQRRVRQDVRPPALVSLLERMARAAGFVAGGAGRQDGIRWWSRLGLLRNIMKNHRAGGAMSSPR